MIENVSFRNKSVEIAAHLRLPDDFSADEKYPALVGIHPAGGVKEQTIGHYAKRLASHGFVTVVYDSSCQGDAQQRTAETRGAEPVYARTRCTPSRHSIRFRNC
ncbi:hypothetical protein [Streptomyces afghaniensis]|uniref:hypothetical protein n=1 Tax=Streptomyces afghaniensis TaxID=66865 RepID=UPI0037A88A77